MTTNLRTRLAELADDAPMGGPDATLWARGRRLSRRRRAGTAVIVAAVALVLSVMGAWSWERSPQPPAPAVSGDGLRLPNQFFVPGERTDGTDDAGPIGPVTAVLRAPRDGGDTGLAG